MKTIFKISITIAVLFFSKAIHASNSIKGTPNSLDHLIESNIQFPTPNFEEKKDVVVLVSLSVNANGEIIVHEVNSSNVEFQKHVIFQLTKIRIDSSQKECGQSFCYKFKFHYLQ